MSYQTKARVYETPFDFDMALQEPVFYMMNTGLLVDLEQKNEFSIEYNARWKEHQAKLNAVVGWDLNVNSVSPQGGKVGEWLYGQLGLPERRFDNRITTRETALRSLLAYCEQRLREVKTQSAKDKYVRGYISIMLILKVRGVRKRISSYINAKVDNDLRMRTSISVGGTETGRFSHSKTLWGTGCNLATVPRELRSMFIASEGKELAEFDLNRGESWVYAHLSEDPELMRIHTSGGDFHAETAVAIASAFGEYIRDWEEWSEKVGPDKAYKMRFCGKKTNHASAYREGAFNGAAEFNKEAEDTGITCTVGQFKKALSLWNRKYIRMQTWWDLIEIQLDQDRTLETPYGRNRIFYAQWGDELFKEATAYVPQSTSVDYLNRGMLEAWQRLVKPGYHGLTLNHQQHDSIVVEYDEGKRDEVIPAVIECIESVVDVNGYEITIPVEVKYGQRWEKGMEKWKAE